MTRVALLALLLCGCRTAYVVVPGTERDGWWDGCSSDGWWHCYGSGPIHKVCAEDGIWPLFTHKHDCGWRRVGDGGPEALVPYRDPKGE